MQASAEATGEERLAAVVSYICGWRNFFIFGAAGLGFGLRLWRGSLQGRRSIFQGGDKRLEKEMLLVVGLGGIYPGPF